MSAEFEAGSSFYITGEGTPVELISLQKFHDEERHSLSMARLQDSAIYKTNVVSKRFVNSEAALTFDVLIRRPALRGDLARASFTLSTLDNDYRPQNIYYATMLSNSRWIIQAPHEPIPIFARGQSQIIDQISQGYLLEHDGPTVKDIIEAAVSGNQREDIYNKLKENLERSRQNPLHPSDRD